MTASQIGVKPAQPAAVESPSSNAAKVTKENNEANEGDEDIFSSLLLLALLGVNKTVAGHHDGFSFSTEGGEDIEKAQDILSTIPGEDTGRLNLTAEEATIPPDFRSLLPQERVISPGSDMFSAGVKEIGEFLRDIDHHDKTDTIGDNNEQQVFLEGSDMIAFSTQDTAHIETDNKTHPFHTYIERASVVQQISREMAHTFQIGSNSARIRLEPPELGELYIEISVVDDTVKTMMTVENQEVKEIIETSLGQLEDELRNHGLMIEQFTVEMSERGPRDRFISQDSREDAGGRKRAFKDPDYYSINQVNLNSLVTMSSGLLSIFA